MGVVSRAIGEGVVPRVDSPSYSILKSVRSCCKLLGEGVALLDLHLLVEIAHKLSEDERIDVLAQLVQQEPVADPGSSCDRLHL